MNLEGKVALITGGGTGPGQRKRPGIIEIARTTGADRSYREIFRRRQLDVQIVQILDISTMTRMIILLTRLDDHQVVVKGLCSFRSLDGSPEPRHDKGKPGHYVA